MRAIQYIDKAGAKGIVEGTVVPKFAEKRIRLPIDHPEPARCLLTRRRPHPHRQRRVGFVLANEFSDHVLEQKNWPIPSCVCPPSVGSFCSRSRPPRSTASKEAH
ncbi:MAG TPA: hypothetical protein VGH40_01965 [Roseiarcus sp.]|jgi:hypothetical protein